MKEFKIYSYQRFSWKYSDFLWAVDQEWEVCYWDEVDQYILMDGHNITTGQRLHVIERVIRTHTPDNTYEIKNALVVPIQYFNKHFKEVVDR